MRYGILFFLFLTFCLSFLSQCKRQVVISTTGYIIGDTNEIRTVQAVDHDSLPEEVRNSIVALVRKLGGGKLKVASGFIAQSDESGNYQIVTNNHVISDHRTTLALNEDTCKGLQVVFGFVKDKEGVEVKGCKPGTTRTFADGDLAAFTLDENPEDERFKPLEIDTRKEIPIGTEALLLHYPTVDANDPEKGEKEGFIPALSSKIAYLQISDKCTVSKAFSPEEAALERTLQHGMGHTCDLIPGSSGSPLLDKNSGKVLGTNWGGIALKQKQTTTISNVFTLGYFVQQLLEGKLNSSDSSSGGLGTATTSVAASKKKEKEEPGMCGVLGNTQGTGHPLFWISILLVPLFFVRRRDRV